MKSLISALVISAASVFPATASIHDFSPENSRPTQQRARVGEGQCINTRDKSKFCFVKTTPSNFSIAIRDVDYPNVLEVAHIDCSTGRWNAYGDLPKATIELYLNKFCPTFG
jgi:hypothetical protein